MSEKRTIWRPEKEEIPAVEVVDAKARAIARRLFEDYVKQHEAGLQK